MQSGGDEDRLCRPVQQSAERGIVRVAVLRLPGADPSGRHSGLVPPSESERVVIRGHRQKKRLTVVGSPSEDVVADAHPAGSVQ